VYLVQLHKGAARVAPPGACGRIGGLLETTWCGVPTLAFDAVQERAKRVAEAERVRTLYVGMTRARERLVVSGVWPEFLRGGDDSHAALLATRDPARPDWAELAGRTVDGRAQEHDACWVVPALRAPAPEATAELALGNAADSEPIAAAAPIADAEARMALPIGAPVTALAAAEPEAERGDRAGARSSAALIGTVIHAALERLDLAAEPGAQWSAQRERIAAQIRAAAAPGVREGALADALACWDALGAGPLAARLREVADRILARELPVLLGPSEGALGFVAGSIDLLYRGEDGRLVVVDYKTDRDGARGESGTPHPRYAKQGELYCRAVGEALGAVPPPRFEIWWLRTGRIEAIL